jgi:L-ascorbate metabolism protein UlaG (beta-lactamase superfamily)
MKITYLTQASLLIEFEGKKLLMDPWLVGSCWGGNIWHYPPPKIKPEEIKDIDFLYLSHAHDDHLHPESLARLNSEVRAAKTLVPDFKAPYFEKALNANGLNNIYKMNNSESISLTDNTSAVMFINDQGDHDSSLLIQSNGTNIFFQTDNILSVEEAKRIGEKYDIDIVFTITSLT